LQAPEGEDREQHRIQAVPGSVQRTAQNDPQGREDVERRHHPKVSRSRGHDVGVRVEDADQAGSEPEQQESGRRHEQNVETGRQPCRPSRSRRLTGTEVLSHHRRGSAGQRECRHQDDHVQAQTRPVGGHGGRAASGHDTHHHCIHEAAGQHLAGTRNADAKNAPRQAPIGPPLAQPHMNAAFPSGEHANADPSRRHLRDHRRQGRSADRQPGKGPKAEDQKRVQDDVQDIGHRHDQQGAPRVSRALERGVPDEQDEGCEVAQQEYPEIRPPFRRRIRCGPQQVKQLVRHQPAGDSRKPAEHHGEHQGLAGRRGGFLQSPGPERPGHQGNGSGG
jgi:hypothetical protein